MAANFIPLFVMTNLVIFPKQVPSPPKYLPFQEKIACLTGSTFHPALQKNQMPTLAPRHPKAKKYPANGVADCTVFRNNRQPSAIGRK
jgi:hypothetical protein